MIILEKHIVPKGNYHIRIQEYAGRVFKHLQSRSATKKAIAKKLLLINGVPAQTSDWIKAGQRIELVARHTTLGKIFPLKLEVLFEDEFMASIKKPAGYPTSGNYYKTIENALPYNLKPSTEKDALAFPKPVHRLDNSTSGILLIAKTKTAQIALHKQFEEKKITKTYHAVVAGKTAPNGIIETPIDNLKAVTKFETIQQVPSIQNAFLSLLKLNPITGRTHQLRIHLSEGGFPIIGDKIYAPNNIMKHKGLFLCATAISFEHPITTKALQLEIKIPDKFLNYLERERKRFNKYH